jgi:hypothetical protein
LSQVFFVIDNVKLLWAYRLSEIKALASICLITRRLWNFQVEIERALHLLRPIHFPARLPLFFTKVLSFVLTVPPTALCQIEQVYKYFTSVGRQLNIFGLSSLTIFQLFPATRLPFQLSSPTSQ